MTLCAAMKTPMKVLCPTQASFVRDIFPLHPSRPHFLALAVIAPPPYSHESGADIPNILPGTGSSGLRKRRKRSKFKPYSLDSDDEIEASSSSGSSRPATPPLQEDCYSHSYDADADTSLEAIYQEHMWGGEDLDSCCPAILPQYSSETLEEYRPLSLMESVLDKFAPYREISDPRCDFGKVLGRLVTEWYAVGGCLLATAA